MFVIFAAPLVSENAFRMISAIAGLDGVRLGVITHDGAEKLRDLQGRVAHWRIDNVLDVPQLLWAASALQERNGQVHRLFGAYEQLQVPLAVAREAMGVDGMSVDTATNFRDKARMKTLLRGAGLPCARHRLAGTMDDALAFAEATGFPLVVKPQAGAGAIATYRLDRMSDLVAALAGSPPTMNAPVLLEEFVVGEEHSFETVSIEGRPVWHSWTHYYPTPLTVLENPWIQWSVVLPRETDDPQIGDIRSAGPRALGVLGMRTGISHMEWFRRVDGSIAISEVAARPPGAQITTLMSLAHDFDLIQEWGRAMIFGEFRARERKYAAGVAFLRGQGNGRVVAVHGVDQVQRDLGDLIVESRIPEPGTTPTTGYEGEGYVIVRHPTTRSVEEAVLRIVSTIRIQLG